MRFETPLPAPGPRSPLPGRIRNVRTKLHPMKYSSRRKPRRWPLVLRFIKGAIHGMIVIPVLLHAVWAVAIVCIHTYTRNDISLPTSIIPSMSIVVGLMLVFRNKTSWSHFWDGRTNLTHITTCVRNLARTFLTISYLRDQYLDPNEQADVDRTIRVLIAIPFAVKNHLRAEWGAAFATTASEDIEQGDKSSTPHRLNPEFGNLLPAGLEGHEDEGLGLPLQLTFMIEAFITRASGRGWFSPPLAAQLSNQINLLVAAYGKMETIRITPMPVGHLIHQKQVLALFGCILPFAMIEEMGWWTILIVSLVTFTLYGIEGMGSELEDPFGRDRNDIKMDAIVEDTRIEIFAMLDEWKRSVHRWEHQRVKPDMFLNETPPATEGSAPTR